MSISTELKKIKNIKQRAIAESIVRELSNSIKNNFKLSQLCFHFCFNTDTDNATEFRNIVSAELNKNFGTNYDIN